MSIEGLTYVNEMMQGLSIPYSFVQWEQAPPDDRYWVGEYIEAESMTLDEDGYQETTLVLRGFTRGPWMTLEKDKATIEKNASRTAILPNGAGIAVSYGDGIIVPTGDAELKSMKINLKIQEWKVN